MKNPLTRGEKWLFASPLLLLVVAGIAWQWQKARPIMLENPTSLVAENLAFSPDGKRLLAIFQDKKTFQQFGRVYDLETKSQVCDLAAPTRLTTDVSSRIYAKPSWSPDGNSIAMGINTRHSSIGTIQIWNAQTGMTNAKYPYETSEELKTSVRFTADGKTLIAEGDTIARYDVATGKRLGKPKPIFVDGSLRKLNEKRGLLALTDKENNSFRVVDTKTGRPVWKLPIRESLEFEWADDILCVRGYHKTGRDSYKTSLLLWDGKTRQLLTAPPVTSQAEINDFSFNADKTTFTYVSLETRGGLVDGPTDFDSELVTWDYRKNRVVWRYKIPTAIFTIQWSPDGGLLKVLAGTSEDYQNRLLVFDKNGNLQLELQPVRVNTCWADNGKQLAVDVEELDSNRNTSAHRLEIHRFVDE